MDLARDTFTEPAYTVLSTTTEELNGASWAGFTNSNRLLISPVGRVFRSAYNPLAASADRIEGSDSFLIWNPPSGNYKVSMIVTWLGPYEPQVYGVTGIPADWPDSAGFPIPPFPLNLNWQNINGQWINDYGINNNPSAGTNFRVYLYARINPANRSECYTVGYETTGNRYVICKDQTDISAEGPVFVGWNATASATAWSTNESRLFEFTVNGTSLSFDVNGVNIFSRTQSDYSTGQVGFEFKAGSSPVRGFHIDDFKVEDLSGPGSSVANKAMTIIPGLQVRQTNGRN